MMITFTITGLICGFIGYFIGKSQQKPQIAISNLELETCKKEKHALEEQIAAYRQSEKSNQNLISTPTASHQPFNAEEVKSIFGKKIKENDLKVIEGIGPKIEELFTTSGIQSWKNLSETSVDRCREILMKAGERYAIHDPGTWPRQAKLAYEGKWHELKNWQDQLDGGREK